MQHRVTPDGVDEFLLGSNDAKGCIVVAGNAFGGLSRYVISRINAAARANDITYNLA